VNGSCGIGLRSVGGVGRADDAEEEVILARRFASEFVRRFVKSSERETLLRAVNEVGNRRFFNKRKAECDGPLYEKELAKRLLKKCSGQSEQANIFRHIFERMTEREMRRDVEYEKCFSQVGLDRSVGLLLNIWSYELE
jgi:hypothetical protein